MDEITKEFLVESYESLDRLDSDFVALEDSPEDLERLASIFRSVHTIKGTSGFLAFPKLEKLAHVGENLLVPLRDGDLKLDHEIADALLGMVDAIRGILGNIEAGGAEGDEEFGYLIQRLEELTDREREIDATGNGVPVPEAAEAVSELEATATESEHDVADSKLDVPPPQPAAAQEGEVPSRRAAKIPQSDTATRSTGTPENSTQHTVADASVRIDVVLLDKLMNQVGELVLARNQILQFTGTVEDAALVAASQRLNLITTELQEGVMKTRMQPIRNAWNKLPRVVRDLSAACDKKVEVVMEGAETELDKTILEAIKDPLTHIVRNSVDHGIETPDVRTAAGKPATGTLMLRAFHESGLVNIEISDDGCGINRERIRDKAIEKELVTPEQVAEMNPQELTNLILLPGFSTAEQVTNVSGRGVGMDVVKTNIEQIGGSVEILSVPGEGTTLRIKIPLTLAIVPALIISTGNESYAIPQVNLLELVRLDGDRAKDAIEFIHDVPVYRLRGNLLPLVYLDEQLRIREKRKPTECEESINIVVLQAEDRQYGLVVDSINDTQEIVVKPLGRHLKNVDVYAGATIMGDGTVALILDTIGIAKQSSVSSSTRDKLRAGHHRDAESGLRQTSSMLIVDPGDGTRAAVQLSSVARLEEFSTAQIEQSHGEQVVQYRDAILPLVPFSHGHYSTSDTDRVQTVVFASEGKHVGVLVGRIIDIVEERLADTDASADRRAVIQERVTEIIDLESWIRTSRPDLFV